MLKKINRTLLAVASLIVLMFLSGCSKIEVDSSWTGQRMKMNGDDSLWSASARYIKDANVLVGVRNDDKYVYVFMSLPDSRNMERQIFGRGMTVWFDPGGGSVKVIGVDFPIGMRSMRREFMREREGGEVNGNGRRFRSRFEKETKEFKILEPGKNVHVRTSSAETKEIEVNFSRDHGNLVYKLKISVFVFYYTRLNLITTNTGRIIWIIYKIIKFVCLPI